jgi:peptidylprolyl isomerase
MARAEAPDSADTQFYITLGAFPHLDDKYTAIGQVVDYGEKSGEKDVLDRLSQGDEIIELRFE